MMDLVVSWLFTAVAAAFSAFVDLFTDVFGFDIAAFNATFEFASVTYKLMRDIGLAVALLLSVWQIIQFFTKGADHAPTTPTRAVLSAVVSIGFIYYGNYLLEMILQFCKYPYATLNSMGGIVDAEWNWAETFGEIMASVFAQTSMLLALIMLLLISFSFVKLLLEVVERYVVTFALLYLSPLVSSTIASSTTSGIYKKFITMFIFQCILLFLNSWCLKLAVSAMSFTEYEGPGEKIVPMLLCYAFLRFSAKLDSYINQLGLNAAITGGGIGAEILGAAGTILGINRLAGGGSGSAGGSAGGGSPVLGAVKLANTWAARVSPVNAIGRGLVDTVKGASEGFRSGAGVKDRFIKTAIGAKEGIANSDNGLSWIGKGLSGRNSRLKNQLANGVPVPDMPQKPVDYDTLPKTEQKKYDDALSEYNRLERMEQNNITAWAHNPHLAHQAFHSAQKDGITVNSDNDGQERIAAVAKGLGVDRHSREAAEFVRVGFGQADGVDTCDFRLDNNGIYGEYDKDGYRNKLHVYSQSQYNHLSTPEREGLDQIHLRDGHSYYIGISRTKLGEPQAKEEKKSAENNAPNNSAETTTEPTTEQGRGN